MNVCKTIEHLNSFLNKVRQEKKTVGLVPTMGMLHEGHIALIERSKKNQDITVCSIYVNPSQFNDAADFDCYPRNEKQDLTLLANAHCDAVFIPHNEEMYTSSQAIHFDFGSLDKSMEGKHRPGHFSGVARVVAKLFNIVNPNTAYFGQKDYQQFKIISLLQEDLKFPLHLSCIPTVRMPSGLAFSSRNRLLTRKGLTKAALFYEALNRAKEAVKNGIPLLEAHRHATQKLNEDQAIHIDYFDFVDRNTLALLNEPQNPEQMIICMAGTIEKIRLIDNIFVGKL